MHLHGCRDTRRDAERHLQSAQLPTAGSAGSIRCDWLLRLRVCAVSWRRGSQVTGAGCQMPGATPLRRALGGRCGMFSNRSNRDLNFETEATTAASHRSQLTQLNINCMDFSVKPSLSRVPRALSKNETYQQTYITYIRVKLYIY